MLLGACLRGIDPEDMAKLIKVSGPNGFVVEFSADTPEDAAAYVRALSAKPGDASTSEKEPDEDEQPPLDPKRILEAYETIKGPSRHVLPALAQTGVKTTTTSLGLRTGILTKGVGSSVGTVRRALEGVGLLTCISTNSDPAGGASFVNSSQDLVSTVRWMVARDMFQRTLKKGRGTL